jgi:hypothetical protein
MPECGGTTISTGSVGLKSSPEIHAAVEPAKTVSAGSNRCHAPNTCHGSSARPLQQYSPAPMRRHALPFSELFVSPAVLASPNENGLSVSSVGIRGVRGIPKNVV